jgi:hypothetical protein
MPKGSRAFAVAAVAEAAAAGATLIPVPVVSSVAGWAIKEAILWLHTYAERVLQCGERLRELLDLIRDARLLKSQKSSTS